MKEKLHYNFGSVATKQHTASMLIEQQQKPSKTLQECVQRIFGLTAKIKWTITSLGKDLAHITHFIRNLHSQTLQHYVLGKNQTLVYNAITLAQKTDAELRIMK